MILGILTVGSLIWYLATTPRSQRPATDRHRRCQRGRGQLQDPGPHADADRKRRRTVKAGQVIATIESEDLDAALKAAEATAPATNGT